LPLVRVGAPGDVEVSRSLEYDHPADAVPLGSHPVAGDCLTNPIRIGGSLPAGGLPCSGLVVSERLDFLDANRGRESQTVGRTKGLWCEESDAGQALGLSRGPVSLAPRPSILIKSSDLVEVGRWGAKQFGWRRPQEGDALPVPARLTPGISPLMTEGL
jgi:hypothetical protein